MWCSRCLVLVSLLLAGCQPTETVSSDRGNGDSRDVRSLPVAAAEVKHRDLSRRLVLSADVRARQVVRLTARSRGLVEQILVEEGDAVSAGQLLLVLELSEQRAELQRAAAVLEQAKLAYQRQQQLFARNLTSAADYQSQAAALRVAESEHQLWQTRLAFGQIVAPRSGVVSMRAVELGEVVREQDTLLEISAMDELVLHLGVSERDVAQLQVGAELSVQLDAMPGLDWPAQVRRIFPATDSLSRFVTVEVALPAEAYSQGVKPGFLARANMLIDAREQVLAVPASAVVNQDDKPYVFLIRQDRLHLQHVELGVSRGQWLEISSGLQQGDIVLANASLDMQHNQPVRIVGWRG
ncbi:efflux RND transporter periplasmic adaptor subunit [Arsukibacterium sp.]|uniref:efflux RND transporter periplasmic adaptor subunit n=1 Tax=Arsukibacterium sp. TaxID=1977258 RepID=UPI002FDB7494